MASFKQHSVPIRRREYLLWAGGKGKGPSLMVKINEKSAYNKRITEKFALQAQKNKGAALKGGSRVLLEDKKRKSFWRLSP